MNLGALNQHIQCNNIESAINIIEKIGRDRYEEALPLLIEHLKTTNNHLLRNAIALALRDIGSQKAVEPIIEVLNNPKTLGYRGTLLYALEPLDYTKHIELLIDFIIQGNFEVSRQSLLLIESISSHISDETLQKCISKLKQELEILEEKHELLSETLELILESKKE